MKKLYTYLLPLVIMAFSFSTTSVQAQELAATCSGTPSEIYFGLTDFQTATITGTATGGTGPYTIRITMNRPIICNYIDAAGNETFVGVAGQTANGNCVTGSPSQPPVAIITNAVAGVPFVVNATLLQNATFTTTVTDAMGSTATSTVTVIADDARCFAGNSGPHKVVLCHRTSSVTNPLVKICVDESAVARHMENHEDFLGNVIGECVDPRIFGIRKGTDADVGMENSANKLAVTATPNPSSGYFTLRMKSVSAESVKVKVMDMLGRIVETKINITPNSTITFGSEYRPGAYLIEVVQGAEKRMIRLLKR